MIFFFSKICYYSYSSFLPFLIQGSSLLQNESHHVPEARLSWSTICTKHHFASGLDTNGCPLGNSKFILLSDNLNICLWLSACQVEKIIKLAWSASHNVIGAVDNVNISCGHILFFAGLLSLYTLCYHCYFSLLSSSWAVIAVSGSMSL